MKYPVEHKFAKQWWISLSEACNWKCWYCDFPMKKDIKTVDADYLKWFLNILKPVIKDKNIEICVEGGEIGLVDSHILDIFFNSDLDKSYTVTTNGLFMKQDYHNRYKDHIHYILYHVVSDVTDPNVVFEKYKDTDPSIKIDYTIVIHKRNIKYLDEFFDNNKDCIFLPHLMQPRRLGLDFLSIEEFEQIYDILKDKENVYDHFKNRILNIIQHLKEEQSDPTKLKKMRDFCANVYHKPIFDLPNKLIKRCCITIDNCNAADITEENLYKLVNNDVSLFPKTDPICDNCIANFLWRHNPKWMLKYNRDELMNITRSLRRNNYHEVL